MAEISDDFMHQRLATARPFTVAILHHGPNYYGPEAQQIIWEHGRRNMKLQANGLMSIACAIDDGSDVGGVAIFGTDKLTTEEVLAGDPAVVAGVFRFTLHTSFSFPGDALQVWTPPTDAE